jgi:hypothetical protein
MAVFLYITILFCILVTRRNINAFTRPTNLRSLNNKAFILPSCLVQECDTRWKKCYVCGKMDLQFFPDRIRERKKLIEVAVSGRYTGTTLPAGHSWKLRRCCLWLAGNDKHQFTSVWMQMLSLYFNYEVEDNHRCVPLLSLHEPKQGRRHRSHSKALSVGRDCF